MRIVQFIPLLSLACDPFGSWPQGQDIYLNDSLWDSNVVDVNDGVYIRLPYAKGLIRIDNKGQHTLVDLNGAEPVRIQADKAQDRVLVFAQWPICRDDDPEITRASECPDGELSTGHELAVVDKGRRTSVSAIPGHLNRVAEAPDGQTVVAYLDYDENEELDLDPIVDLTEVRFIDLDSGNTRAVSVGFSPRNILFTQDGTRAVILSRSKVVVIDLESFDVTIEYPLTLDADHELDPASAVLSPDDRYALISIAGSRDLYKLDLEVVSIDMEGLDQIPSDMATDFVFENTILVYGGDASADVITEHDFIERNTVDLDEPANRIAMGDGFAVLYHDGNDTVHDIVRLDLDTFAVVEYVADNPVDSLEITPGGEYAVAVLRPEDRSGSGLDAHQNARWGLAVADLTGNDIVSLMLSSPPVGVELVEKDGSAYALVLLEDIESLIQVDLAEPGAYTTVDLPAPPAGIFARPDGTFTIPHETDLGLVSFLDPETGTLSTVSGFATVNLLTDQTLPRRDSDKE
jgi:hypothetical protein